MSENSSSPPEGAPERAARPVTHASGVTRRGFFRGLVVRSLDQVQQAGQRLADSMPDVIGQARPQTPQTAQPDPAPHGRSVRYLRPPGALPETAFLDACTRCGDCIHACPAQCITVRGDDGPASFPHILPRHSPCVVCDDLACMKVCPTDALTLVARTEIAMGTALVDTHACLRERGEDCRLCITQCPIGETALALDDQGRVEVRAGCVGCGVCERACPTEPAAITITPSRAWDTI